MDRSVQTFLMVFGCATLVVAAILLPVAMLQPVGDGQLAAEISGKPVRAIETTGTNPTVNEGPVARVPVIQSPVAETLTKPETRSASRDPSVAEQSPIVPPTTPDSTQNVAAQPPVTTPPVTNEAAKPNASDEKTQDSQSAATNEASKEQIAKPKSDEPAASPTETANNPMPEPAPRDITEPAKEPAKDQATNTASREATEPAKEPTKEQTAETAPRETTEPAKEQTANAAPREVTEPAKEPTKEQTADTAPRNADSPPHQVTEPAKEAAKEQPTDTVQRSRDEESSQPRSPMLGLDHGPRRSNLANRDAGPKSAEGSDTQTEPTKEQLAGSDIYQENAPPKTSAKEQMTGSDSDGATVVPKEPTTDQSSAPAQDDKSVSDKDAALQGADRAQAKRDTSKVADLSATKIPDGADSEGPGSKAATGASARKLPIEVVLSNGRIIRTDSKINPDTLSEFISVLDKQ